MKIIIRPAAIDDVEAIFDVRTSVTENHLSREEMRQMGITESVVGAMIQHTPCAWVATDGASIVGFSMILPDEGCLFAAFVLPAYQSRGIGRALVTTAEAELFKHHVTLWLETAKNSRAEMFYTRLGWGNKKEIDKRDIRLEKSQNNAR
ncbi:GNAT family N-acetyltransferase [Enterobacteriaceae bacterium H4N4]|uniref:GNAT family N-acetyltransferase n=1 Tax=Silvania confinis TaxID=2926470 RepID=A0A9J6QIT1_9ENTR|nr:GNAT family N-acetyltransferase [Silvania confinis]MCU6668261.1 GNAT family N-acetyltransferase [Silvania confinis]